MNDAVVLSRESLVYEAFLQPIRTTVVVDDEFPTLEKLVIKQPDSSAGATFKPADLKRVSDILQFCRSPDRNWLVDVHDGAAVNEGQVAAHLHQCDLLILDFKLQGDAGDSSKALEIIRSVGDNSHFNMVVVYTKENVIDTYAQIALSLISPWSAVSSINMKTVSDIIFEWDDICPGISEKLEECLTLRGYLEVRWIARGKWPNEPHKVAELANLLAVINDAVPGERVNATLMMKWAVRRYEQRFSHLFGQPCAQLLEGMPPSHQNPVNFIRSSKIFLTVVSKGQAEAAHIPNRLMQALMQWRPSPNRLIMTKMRSELEEHGVDVEDRALIDSRLQAGWFHNLLLANDAELDAETKSAVARHWEGLLGGVSGPVADFSRRIVQVEKHCAMGEGAEAIVRDLFGVDLADPNGRRDALMRQNAYHCSIEPTGWHLTTGHVLELDNQLWICLSPACDLVPRERKNGRFKRLQGVLPFKAIMLHPVDEEKVDPLEIATQNLCLFLKQRGDVKAYQFVRKPHENPKWDEFFAHNMGRFEEGPKVSVGRLSIRSGAAVLQEKVADVVAQLRYPYALNLLHRFGAHLSRVGLDFVGTASDDEEEDMG